MDTIGRSSMLDGVAGCGKTTKVRRLIMVGEDVVSNHTKEGQCREYMRGFGVPGGHETVDSLLINDCPKAKKH